MVLDDYFLKAENCTYKEFCAIYNNGEELIFNLPFTNFPEPVLKELQKHIKWEITEDFGKFLESHGLYETYYNYFKRNSHWRSSYRIGNKVLESELLKNAFDWEKQMKDLDFGKNWMKNG